MREIKFRVYDKEAKKILYKPYGFLCYDGTPCYIHNVTKIPLEMKIYTLMQFTGLTDKHGVEIYDGDIIKHPSYCNFKLDGSFVSKVEWGETGDSDGYFHKKHFEWIAGVDSLADIYESSEVIGNVYENPELLNESPSST